VDTLNIPVLVDCDFQHRVGSASVYEDGLIMRITDPEIKKMLKEPGLIGISIAPIYVANAQRFTSD
jgi:hypothetical protein